MLMDKFIKCLWDNFLVSVINIQFTSIAIQNIPDFITGEGEYTHYHIIS